MQRIVKVVGPVSGTVAAPPESEFWLKLPSADFSVQAFMPCVFQKMDVRAPSRTEAGTAQISAFAFDIAAAGVLGEGVGFCFVILSTTGTEELVDLPTS